MVLGEERFIYGKKCYTFQILIPKYILNDITTYVWYPTYNHISKQNILLIIIIIIIIFKKNQEHTTVTISNPIQLVELEQILSRMKNYANFWLNNFIHHQSIQTKCILI